LGKSKVSLPKIARFQLIYKIVLSFIFGFFFLLIVNPENSCELSKKQISDLSGFNVLTSDINYSDYQISIYPEVKNLFCLGKIKEITTSENTNNLLYEEKIINLTLYSSKTLKQFVYILFIIIYLFNLNIFNKKQNHIVCFLLSLLYSLYFFSNFVNFVVFLVLTQLVIYFYFTDELKALNIFLLSKNKSTYFIVFFLTNMFIAYEMVFEEYFFIGSYLINYEYGFMRRGLMGSILLNLNLTSTFGLLILTALILIMLYVLFQFLFIGLLEKNNNIFLTLITFSPLILFYQFINTTHSVNSNLMGGEFLGLLTLVYAAYIKDKQNKYNLFLVLSLFNISIYTHEVNILTLFTLYLILKNRIHALLTLFSVSVFSYLYFLNYSSFSDKFEPLCKQFESLRIRDNICLGGLSNSTSDQVSFGYSMLKDFELLNIIFTQQNKSYVYSILFFLYFVSKSGISKNTLAKSLFVVSAYLPIFLVAIDWGRWLYIIFSSLIILFTISDFKNIKLFTKYDLFLYLAMVFTLKHFGTRGVSYIEIEYEYFLDINFYMLIFILFKNVKLRRKTGQFLNISN